MHHFGKGHAWSKLFLFIYFNLAFRKIIFQGFSAFYLSEHNPVLDQTANNVNWLHNISSMFCIVYSLLTKLSLLQTTAEDP